MIRVNLSNRAEFWRTIDTPPRRMTRRLIAWALRVIESGELETNGGLPPAPARPLKWKRLYPRKLGKIRGLPATDSSSDNLP